MTAPVYELDIDRTCTALDPDYEQWQLTWSPRTYYHTQRRCYVTALVAEPRPAAVTPADPDAAINEAAPLFEPMNKGKRSPVAGRVEDLLRERGPMAMVQIAADLGVPYNLVKNYLYNHTPRFAKERRRGLTFYWLKGA